MQVVLKLPLPPSKNRQPKHPMARHKWVSDTKKATWLAAAAGPENINHRPTSTPPHHQLVTAHFEIPYNLRDHGGLQESLKPVMDALKIKHHGGISKKSGKPYGDQLKWRNGILVEFGYFIDDGPEYLAYGAHTQSTCSLGDQCLILRLTEIPESEWPIRQS